MSEMTCVSFRKIVRRKLRAVQLHNSREMRVPNVDPTVKNGVVVLRGDVKDIKRAVAERLAALGATYPSPKRYVAIEVLYTLSPEARQVVPNPLFFARALECADAQFGPQRIVGAWGHQDEKSPHVHVLFLPVVTGWPPGWRKAQQDQMGTPPAVVSWNQFSGSDKCIMEEIGGRKVRRNPTMAGWQQGWAERWRDFGFRKGPGSKLPPILPRRLHEKTAELAQGAHDFSGLVIDSLTEAPWAGMMACGKGPGEVAVDIVKPLLDRFLPYFVELAARGEQLVRERAERVRLADENALLLHEVDVWAAKHKAACAQVSALQQAATVASQSSDKLRAELQSAMGAIAHRDGQISEQRIEIQMLEDELQLLRPHTPEVRREAPMPKQEHGCEQQP